MATITPSVHTAGTTATGSFTKLIVSGADAKLDIEFGQLTDPVDSGTYNEVLSVQVPEGTHIDGPIAKFKVVVGGAIAYKTTH